MNGDRRRRVEGPIRKDNGRDAARILDLLLQYLRSLLGELVPTRIRYDFIGSIYQREALMRTFLAFIAVLLSIQARADIDRTAVDFKTPADIRSATRLFDPVASMLRFEEF